MDVHFCRVSANIMGLQVWCLWSFQWGNWFSKPLDFVVFLTFSDKTLWAVIQILIVYLLQKVILLESHCWIYRFWSPIVGYFTFWISGFISNTSLLTWVTPPFFGWSKSASLALKSCRRLPKARVWRTSSHSCRCWHEIHDMIWRSWNFLGKRTATKRSRLQDLRCSYSLADKLHILEHNFYMFPLPKARKWQPSILDVSLPYGWNLDMPPMNRKSSYIYIARVCSIDMHWQYLSNITNIAKIGNISNI